MTRKAAILQSNYIPWKGVFDMINQVDIFVFFEDVQFTRRDWRTRNSIKTPEGLQWLSVPVKKAPRETLISEIEINNSDNWQHKHYESIVHNYSRAKFFKDYHFILEELYKKNTWIKLSEFNIQTTKLIANILGNKTEFANSCDLATEGTKDDKLISICKKVNANSYLSGPAAKDYIVDEKFEKANISLSYIEYNYPEYPQLFGSFEHHVTILDLLFNCGPNTPYYIWGWRESN